MYLKWLRGFLRSASPLDWQFLVFDRVDLVRGRATRVALATILKNPPPRTTFILISASVHGIPR